MPPSAWYPGRERLQKTVVPGLPGADCRWRDCDSKREHSNELGRRLQVPTRKMRCSEYRSFKVVFLCTLDTSKAAGVYQSRVRLLKAPKRLHIVNHVCQGKLFHNIVSMDRPASSAKSYDANSSIPLSGHLLSGKSSYRNGFVGLIVWRLRFSRQP